MKIIAKEIKDAHGRQSDIAVSSIEFCCTDMANAVIPVCKTGKYQTYYFIRTDISRAPVEDRVSLSAIDSMDVVSFCPYCGEKVEIIGKGKS